MFLRHHLRRKLLVTAAAALGFAFLYEVTTLDSRYAARQSEMRESTALARRYTSSTCGWSFELDSTRAMMRLCPVRRSCFSAHSRSMRLGNVSIKTDMPLITTESSLFVLIGEPGGRGNPRRLQSTITRAQM